MAYINRQGVQVGYQCSVKLTPAIREYPSTLVTDKKIDSPVFTGYGLTAMLSVVANTAATYIYGYEQPVWVITDSNGNTITTIAGWECSLDIEVYAPAGNEYVDIDFTTDQSGKYVWRGLPESGLPETVLTPSYDMPAFIGIVNGVQYAGAPTDPGISTGVTISPQYSMDPGGYTGDFTAEVKYYNGGPGASDYVYTATGSVNINGTVFNCFWSVEADGNRLYAEGEHLTAGGLRNGLISAGIAKYPAAYKYHITERTGLNIGGLDFTDINGVQWTGPDSGWVEYAGVQTVQADGVFQTPDEQHGAAPNFNINNAWIINDPPPDQIGGITCINPEAATNYSITVTDPETEQETTYKPSRVLIKAPLGPSGNLAGNVSIGINNSTLDTMTEGWQVSAGGYSAHVLVINSPDGGSISKTGYIRGKYTGEQGDLTAAELIPHLPINNILRLSGAGFDPSGAYTLQIEAKGRQYRYNAVNVTSSNISWDLTRPAGFRGSDEAPKYSTIHLPEQYTGDNSEDGRYWIEEKASELPLYGPALFSSISIGGFAEGQYTLTAIYTERADNNIYYHFAPEFSQVENVGRQYIGGQDHPIDRNRQGVIATAGRFCEIPANQRDTAPSGVTIWHFPKISELEGTGAGSEPGDRLIFPRDDYNAISIAAGTRAAGGNTPPVNDLVSERAYTGWLYTEASVTAPPQITPTVDLIDYAYFYNAAFNELEAVIDLAGGWQGFTGVGTLTVGSGAAASDTQYMIQGQVSPEQLTYRVNNEIKRQKQVETPPGGLCRYAIRFLEIHGKILRNAAGKILRNAAGKILRGDFEV